MEYQSNFFYRRLDSESLNNCALEFAAITRQSALAVSLSELNETNIGSVVEKHFKLYLESLGYDLERHGGKGDADFRDLHVDLKCICVNGRRGGAAKFHGYSKTFAPPTYDLLIFGYEKMESGVCIASVWRIPGRQVNWVQAKHFLFSIPDSKLTEYKIG